MAIARKFVHGAATNMIKNLKYYNNRDKDTSNSTTRIEMLMASIDTATDVDVLMGIEGNIRMSYYESFDVIINDFEIGTRSKQPPSNEVNALVSFINSLCYLCASI